LGLCAALLAAGCGFRRDVRKAEAVVSDVYEAVRDGDIDRALSFYSHTFFLMTPREEWKATLTTIAAQLGTPQSWTLLHHEARKDSAEFDAPRYLMLKVSVDYARGQAVETLILFKSAWGEYRIHRHNIQAGPPPDAGPGPSGDPPPAGSNRPA
jgi:hypothetical protein